MKFLRVSLMGIIFRPPPQPLPNSRGEEFLFQGGLRPEDACTLPPGIFNTRSRSHPRFLFLQFAEERFGVLEKQVLARLEGVLGLDVEFQGLARTFRLGQQAAAGGGIAADLAIDGDYHERGRERLANVPLAHQALTLVADGVGQLDDGVSQRAPLDLGQNFLGRLFAVGVHFDLQQRTPFLDLDKLVVCPPLFQLDQHKALLLVLLAEVDAVRAAGVDHVRLAVLVQVLVLVNVPEGDVVERRIGQRRDRHLRLAHVEVALLPRRELRAGHPEMAHQDGRDVVVGGLYFFGQKAQVVDVFGFQHAARLVERLARELLARNGVAFDEIRHGRDQHRPGSRGDHGSLRLAHHVDVRHAERAVDFDRVGASTNGRHVVIADQQHDRNAVVRQPPDAVGELALIGLARIAGLIGVAGKDGQMDSGVQGQVHRFEQRQFEIFETGIQAGFGVEATIQLYAKMRIGKVHDADRLAHSLPFTTTDFYRLLYQVEQSKASEKTVDNKAIACDFNASFAIPGFGWAVNDPYSRAINYPSFGPSDNRPADGPHPCPIAIGAG